MRSDKHFLCGFTLIELMVVLTIIMVLTAIGFVSYGQASVNTRNSKRKADMEQIRAALVLYRTDIGNYPQPSGASLGGLGLTGTPPLTTLTGYISSTNVLDPKNTGTYTYTYQTNNSPTPNQFLVCANLEPSSTAYCLANP